MNHSITMAKVLHSFHGNLSEIKHRMGKVFVAGGVVMGTFTVSANAQPGYTEWLSPGIKTLRLMVNDTPNTLPVIQLGGKDVLNVSFDCMTHEYQRYTYRIEHCDFEGNPTTDLFESDYVSSAFEEEVIEDYEPSLNTTVQYTHYSFSLPNRRMRPLLSGNYRLTVSTENQEGDVIPVIRTYFAVLDQKVTIHPVCSTNTEIDWNETHQQLSIRVNGNDLEIRDANHEIKLLVMQNKRLDNAVTNIAPTAQNANTMIWEHDRRLIFKAGNEYRKMEMLSTRYPGMHGDQMKWFDPYYHYTLQQDFPRENYLYDEDQNGARIIRCEGSGDADIEADYVMTHFSLSMLPQLDKEIYVHGNWTTADLNPEYRMRYNPENQAYEANILLKQGYYNYMYLSTDRKQPLSGQTALVEGDFFQTENEYDILVYYQPTGSRYCQLVGCVTPIFKK